MIGSNNILNNKVIQTTSKKTLTIQSCQPCSTTNSLCCDQVKSNSSFKRFVTHNSYNIYHKTNCKSYNTIYLLECILCTKKFIGKSEWPFNLRLNNYRHRIKSDKFEKLLPVEQYFLLPYHDFSTHAKFTINRKNPVRKNYVNFRILWGQVD